MNNNPRIYLWIALALVGWLNYQAWMTDYGPRPGANITANAQGSGAAHGAGGAGDLSSKIPQATKAEPAAGTADSKQVTPSPTAAAAPAESAAASAATAAAQVVHVHTDVLDLDISMLGGTISKADLLKYTDRKSVV